MSRAARCTIALGAVVIATVWACASEQFPPGGPERRTPPKLIETIPETNAVDVKPKRVVFRFDEVVSEQPSGVQSLDQLFLVSPGDRKAPPDVAWHRDHFSLSPHRGFRSKTTYTVTLLPGLSDLRGNTQKTGSTLTFSTGPTIPSTVVRGVVFDWIKDAAAPKAWVEAWVPPDTNTVYLTVADSLGRFALAHLPPARYVVRGYVDQNNNRRLDPRETWDSVGVTLADSTTVELDAFIHDTIGPRIAEARPIDSVTLRLTFDKAIDTTQRLDPSVFAIKRKDSTAVPIATAMAGRTYDSLTAARQRAKDDSAVRADSIKRAGQGGIGRDTSTQRKRQALRQARRDSIAQAKILRPAKPVPVLDAVLTLGEPLMPATLYRVSANGLRNLLAHARTSFIVLAIPKRDTTKADSARGRRPGGRAGGRGRGKVAPALDSLRDSVRDSIPEERPPTPPARGDTGAAKRPPMRERGR